MSSEMKNNANAVALLSTRGWVSLRQFATLAGVSYPTALRLAEKGEVKTVRVGAIRRVNADELHRFLKEGNATDQAPEVQVQTES